MLSSCLHRITTTHLCEVVVSCTVAALLPEGRAFGSANPRRGVPAVSRAATVGAGVVLGGAVPLHWFLQPFVAAIDGLEGLGGGQLGCGESARFSGLHEPE